MSNNILIQHHDDITEITFLARVAASDAPAVIKSLGETLKTRLRLYEFATDWNPTREDIKSVAALAGKLVSIPDSRIAFVAPTNLGYGLARMYEAYRSLNDEAPPLKVFRDKDSAREWLKS